MQVNSTSCMFSILSVLIPEALFVLSEQFCYCLHIISACLPAGTACYIVMVVVEAAKYCRHLLFGSTRSAMKGAFPCSCQRTL